MLKSFRALAVVALVAASASSASAEVSGSIHGDTIYETKLSKMSDQINQNRRQFFGRTAMAVAAAQFGMIGPVEAEASKAGATKGPGGESENSSFGALRRLDAGVLNVGYVDAGAADRPVALLLHGWPYDIHSFAEVVPLLTDAGY
jgi:hypothetical protein